MDKLSIGQVARQLGIRASAIRYYEAEGLIPKTSRESGRRVYDPDILHHLIFIRLALRSGFGISEIKPLVRGLTSQSQPGERWRAVADKKLVELDRDIAALQSKKRLLQNLATCHCKSLKHFVETTNAHRARSTSSGSPAGAIDR